jgi:hypothetical protein
MSYIKEFCTIKLCAARQAGHTTAAIKLIAEKFDKAVIIVPTYRMAEHIKDLAKENNCLEKILIVTHNNLEIDLCGLNINNIIVDCSFSMSSKKEEELYRLLIPSFTNALLNKKKIHIIFLQ